MLILSILCILCNSVFYSLLSFILIQAKYKKIKIRIKLICYFYCTIDSRNFHDRYIGVRSKLRIASVFILGTLFRRFCPSSLAQWTSLKIMCAAWQIEWWIEKRARELLPFV